jgi:ubiquinone/menaquinone biosynthesis C-methylase UbiE
MGVTDATTGSKAEGQAQTLSQQRFGQYAENYVTSVPHAQGADLDRLLELAEPQADWVMLDVATGGGHTALKFAPHVAHVTASDVTPAMLEAAEMYLTSKGLDNVTFKHADAEAMPFDAASFDLVTCRIAPHHFDDAARFVHEAARVLKPGGMLLVQDHLVPEDRRAARYIEAFEKLRDPSHNRAFTEGEWRAMFVDAGLTVTHVEGVTKELIFETWTERQGVTENTKACLIVVLEEAPAAVLDWLQPRAWGTSDAAFQYRYVIIRGTKDSNGS